MMDHWKISIILQEHAAVKDPEDTGVKEAGADIYCMLMITCSGMALVLA